MRETNPTALRAAMLRILDRRAEVTGALALPCIPSLLESYVIKLLAVWQTLGKPFSEAEVANLRSVVEKALNVGYSASPASTIVVEYQSKPAPDIGISYQVRIVEETISQRYEQWASVRKPPFFGAHPDAKVIDLSKEFSEPGSAPVLDIGAGTGRNAIAVARRGHPTDAVEFVPSLAAAMREEAYRAGVALNIIERDVLAAECVLNPSHYKLAILTEVVAAHFRETDDVRQLFTKLADAMAPGGLVLFDAFLPVDGYKPDDAVRQVSQAAWSCVFTRAELQFIHQELPFEKVSDESEHDYEQAHRPPEAWPPTTWFPEWSQGLNVFDLRPGKAPVELRWLVYRRR